LIIKAGREDLEKQANNSQHKKYNMRKIIFVLMASLVAVNEFCIVVINVDISLGFNSVN
jgi:hypothetical protein